MPVDACRDLQLVIERLVARPDAVQVRPVATARATELQVRVDPTDLGAVIGRQGRTARALRALLRSRSQGARERLELRILEED